MRVLTILIIVATAWAQEKYNMAKDRGQTPIQDESQTLTRGRLGHQGPSPRDQLTFNGTLLDAGCDDRSALNLRLPPMIVPEPLPPQTKGGVSAKGVTVEAGTLAKERAGIMEHQVPDLRMRQPDLTCAITGSTRSFALLLDDGRYVNLDQGGNTFAQQFLQADAAGRALLNGTGPAIKPRVAILGRIHGDQLIVSRIVKSGGQT
jgi:hypothetical protein